MVTTDPIADLLTRIRNAVTARHETVSIPASKMKKSIVDILVEEGFVTSGEVVEENGHSNIKVVLKYAGNKNAITSLKRISKPGLRVYCGCEDLPKVLGGYGIAIISTSRGVMTDKKARQLKVGGEVLAYVW
ncbi:MAG: 30S ribosomal protein S8 [Clostridiales bacterium]|nr:30S ribosomal protein S8 [Clostridiales bacterium]MCH5350660.1 30S ribosomal protein S8 [Clostridiales bacterium]